MHGSIVDAAAVIAVTFLKEDVVIESTGPVFLLYWVAANTVGAFPLWSFLSDTIFVFHIARKFLESMTIRCKIGATNAGSGTLKVV